MKTCRICQAQGEFQLWQAKEQMFGTQEIFEYFCCQACGCLQISEVPADLSAYYPPSYYSYQGEASTGLRGKLRIWRNHGLLHHTPAALLSLLQPYAALAALSRLDPKPWMRILDVGCGQGQLVKALQEQGFEQTYGIDPFLSQDLSPFIRAQTLAECLQENPQAWDLIMLHHSLEHLADIHQSFELLKGLLKPGGRLLIRVPTLDSWAFEHYKEDWVQWDAPRHLYLFSRQNMHDLAQQYGFQVEALWDDSSSFQFSGSESYRQGLPLSQAKRTVKAAWYWHARGLNTTHRGDQIACVLKARL